MRARWGLLWVLLVGTSWSAMRGQDPVGADAIWQAAVEEGAESPEAGIWMDAARVNAGVAPWQEAWPRARERVAEVARLRREQLPHDRGGRRRAPELP